MASKKFEATVTGNARMYNVTCTELAEAAGVNKSTAWRWMTGQVKKQRPKLEAALQEIVNQRRANSR